MYVPALQLDAFTEIPFALVTRSELARRQMVQVAALDRKLLVVWNGGRPRVYEDSCPHLGLPMTLGTYRAGALHCRYHGWSFSADDGQLMKQPTLRKPQPCKLIRYGALLAGDLIFFWLGDLEAEERVRAKLPDPVLNGMSSFNVEFECPFYLALFSSVDMAHYAFHTGYSPLYRLYKRFRRSDHQPGGAFSGQLVDESEHRATIRVEDASRTIHVYASATEMDDESVNYFQTFVTPVTATRTRYWECYRPRGSALTNFLARATFNIATRGLVTVEDKLWTGASTPNFLRGDNIHLAENDLPLGTHIRKFVLPPLREFEDDSPVKPDK